MNKNLKLKCNFCNKPSYIGYNTGSIVKQVCHFHYKIKVIEEIESTELIRPICEKCKGELRFNGLGVLNDTVVVSFICMGCKQFSQEKRKIDSYFKS